MNSVAHYLARWVAHANFTSYIAPQLLPFEVMQELGDSAVLQFDIP